MFVAPGTGEGPAPKKDRKWLWGLGAWLFWFIVADEMVEAALAWLVATGGYGFSNAIIGLLTLGGCFIGVQRLHVKHRRLETEGDPDPLPAPYDYQTICKAGARGLQVVRVSGAPSAFLAQSWSTGAGG